MDPQVIAAELGQNSYCLCPHFLESGLAKEALSDLNSLRQKGEFKRAGTGARKDIHDDIRRDEIFWLESSPENPVQMHIMQKIENLKLEINRQLYLGLRSFEGHYAFYPPGGFYKKHLDSFQRNNHRLVSVVIYLNADWAPADGGQLRLYPSDRSIDVAPQAGTLVCFLSNEVEHEVLPSRAPRFSFTGWFKTI